MRARSSKGATFTTEVVTVESADARARLQRAIHLARRAGAAQVKRERKERKGQRRKQ